MHDVTREEADRGMLVQYTFGLTMKLVSSALGFQYSSADYEKIYKQVEAVANGEITLNVAPSETMDDAMLPAMRKSIQENMQKIMRRERDIANDIIRSTAGYSIKKKSESSTPSTPADTASVSSQAVNFFFPYFTIAGGHPDGTIPSTLNPDSIYSQRIHIITVPEVGHCLPLFTTPDAAKSAAADLVMFPGSPFYPLQIDDLKSLASLVDTVAKDGIGNVVFNCQIKKEDGSLKFTGGFNSIERVKESIRRAA